MTSSSSPPPIPSSSKRKGGTGKIWLLILAILFVPLMIFAGRHWWLSSKIKSRLAAVRAAHEPVTLAELNHFYPDVPARLNAALAYSHAFELVQKSKSTNLLEHLDDLPLGSGPLPLDLREQMEQAVAENQATFSKLEDAARLAMCRYPVDYSLGWNTLLPHLRQLQKCSRLQLCRGVLQEQHGDVSGALDSVALILRHSASLDSEPDLIGLVIQHKISFHASELLRWILNHRRLSQPDLARLQLVFERPEEPGRLDRALIAERCLVLALFDAPAGGMLGAIDPGFENKLASTGIYFLRVTGKMKADEIRFLERMTECQDALRLPLPEKLDRAAEILAEINQESVPKKFIFTSLLIRGFLKGFGKEAQGIARQQLVRTALATERYRAGEGRLPSSLIELVPDYLFQVPTDPFSGGPLKYANREGGYVVYSVGPDRLDDGGLKPISRKPFREHPPGDIIFAVGR